MRTIAFCNQKGGTGKTTSVVNIGFGLGLLGCRVLVIDLDPQANLTFSAGIGSPDPSKTIYQLLVEQASVTDAVIPHGPVHLIAGSPQLSALEKVYSQDNRGPRLLKKALRKILNDYDFILLDCPPSSGLISQNALVAASEIFVPVQAEYLALQGMSQLLQTVEETRKDYNPGLKLTGIIATRFDRRRVLNREVIEKLQSHFGSLLFKTIIRENISLAEAPSFGQHIFTYRPDSSGAKDYQQLCKEIMGRG
ncbi:MAG: ParA family protein [Syntrophomonas sp.]